MSTEFDLLQPYWLLLLPLPWLWLRWRQHHPSAWPNLAPTLSMRYPPLQHLGATQATSTANPRAEWLLSTALCLFIIGLAQPVEYREAIAEQAPSEPVDMVLVIGTAISMGLQDYIVDERPVDRMALTRNLAKDFVQQYSGRRIGLVILGNPPALWLPLTHDKAVVQDAIARIRTVLGGRLSNMGATLELVDQHFSADGTDKVVVMVTDGSLQLGAISPQEAAHKLASKGFHLYIIAMGATSNQAIQAQSGSLLYQPVNLALLQHVAEQGKGELFHAQNAQAFTDALASIQSKHRKTVITKPQQRLRTAWYPLAILLGMGLLLAATGARP